jgi:hypothetical protein
MKGKIVKQIPGARQSPIDWDSPAILAKLSGQPVLAATHVRDTRIKSVRQYTRPPFVAEDGRIIIEMRNSKTDSNGVRYGDVYMRWESTKKEG